jgi:hypothetical protein
VEAVAMKQKDPRSDFWNHRGFSPVRMSIRFKNRTSEKEMEWEKI